VVTGTAVETPTIEMPYATSVVGEAQVAERLYRTTPLALLDVPGVMVQQTSWGQGSPVIRGFTGFRTLMLVDGIRLNNSTFREGPNQYWNTVDLFAAERLEVLKGTTSVLYGSDAIGGTVNVVTRGPYAYGRPWGLAGRALFRGATAERSQAGRGEGSVALGDRTGILVGGDAKHFGDLEAGAGTDRQPYTGYDEHAFDAKVEHFLRPNVRAVAAYQRLRQEDVPRTHRTIFAKSFEGTSVGSELRHEFDQERDLAYAQLHAEDLDGLVDVVRTSLSWHRQYELRDRLRTGGRRDLQEVDVNTLGAFATLQSGSAVGEWTYGFEYYRDFVRSSSTESDVQGPVADDATYDLFGLYVQDAIDLGKRFTVTVGGRWDYDATDADAVEDPLTGRAFGVSDDWDQLVGNLRLLHRLVPETLHAFAGVSQGFRAPNLSDLTRLDIARTDEIETPSPGLEPEHFITWEVGAKLRTVRVRADVSYFYTDVEDMIVRQPTGRVIEGDTEVRKVNAGDGFIHGVEAAAGWRPLDQLTLFGNIAYLDGEVSVFPSAARVAVDDPPDRLQPLTGLVGVRWDLPRRLWVESVMRASDAKDDLSSAEAADTSRVPPDGTPAWVTADLRAGWTFRERVQLVAGIENLADEDYRIHGSGSNMPGRSFVLAVDVFF
jgi:hemoglobin/transferrin/lactoferrin receptor protein